MKYTKMILASATLLLILGLLGVLSLDVDSQTDDRHSRKSEDSNFPTVSFADRSMASEDSVSPELRRRRNDKFTGSGWVRSTVSEDTKFVFLNNHWQQGLSALPVDKSDVVVVATVNTAGAFLSGDRTGVYSEFQADVVEIYKNDLQSSLRTSDSVSLHCAGGKVHYPDGPSVTYVVRGQDMPRVGGTYVFFLVSDIERSSYYILTAYEIRGEKIATLDGLRGDEKAGWVFQKLNGTSRIDFDRLLRSEVTSKSHKGEKNQ